MASLHALAILHRPAAAVGEVPYIDDLLAAKTVLPSRWSWRPTSSHKALALLKMPMEEP
jgi:hypothetical protein